MHMKLLLVVPATVGALMIAATAGCHAKGIDSSTTVKYVGSRNEVTFTCGKSLKGECAYIVYSTACESGLSANKKSALTCTFASIDEFTLKDGESRKVDNLPANYKHC